MKHFNHLLIVALVAVAAPCVRADEEQDLIATLQSSAGAPQKCAACQKLRVIGTARAVPALAALLGEERTAHAARYALEGMPCPEAVTPLREALGRTTGLLKAGLIDSLGWRRDTASVPLLIPLLSEPDETLASTAASALGRVGGKQSVAALSSARDKVPASVQPAVLGGLLQSAERFQSEGQVQDAAGIYRGLFSPKLPDSIRVAAWRGLVVANVSERPGLVTEALAGPDRCLQIAALKVLRELNDKAVVKACLRQWPAMPAAAQLAVLDTQLKLGADPLPTVRAAAQSPHLAVRVAAWQALGDLGDPSVIPALAKAATATDATERDAARDGLARLRGPGVREALLRDLAAAQPPEKAELLRALGERGDTEAANVLVENAAVGPEPVRLAALESLRRLALPDTVAPLLKLAAGSASDSDCEPILKALYAACQATHDKDQATRVVLNLMGRFSAAERRRVLPVLGELATPAALDAAQAATREADADCVRQAVRVLAQWPNADPAPRLLELGRDSTDSTLQTLALRGAIDLAAQESDPARRLAILQQAIAAAKRPDEKKQALGQLGQLATPEALQVAIVLLPDPDLANEAALAAVTIAEKIARADPKLAGETSDRVLAQCRIPDIVKRAWAIRAKPPGSGPFIQDWLVCGPYAKPGVLGAEAVFKIPFGPEKPGEEVHWSSVPRGDQVNLAALFPDRENCAAYLKTQIIAPEDCAAALLLGSDDGVKAWLNGTVVHSNNVDRGDVPDQDMAPIQLHKGANQLLLKISQGGGGWSAHVRIVAPNGQPIAGLQCSNPLQ